MSISLRLSRIPRPLLRACFMVSVLAGCTSGVTEVPGGTAPSPCPPWVNFPTDDHSNAGSPYLGCTNAANLRGMVENPNDLVQGRPLGPADGERAAAAVNAYEKGQIKPFTNQNAPRPVFVMPGGTTGGSGGGSQ